MSFAAWKNLNWRWWISNVPARFVYDLGFLEMYLLKSCNTKLIGHWSWSIPITNSCSCGSKCTIYMHIRTQQYRCFLEGNLLISCPNHPLVANSFLTSVVHCNPTIQDESECITIGASGCLTGKGHRLCFAGAGHEDQWIFVQAKGCWIYPPLRIPVANTAPTRQEQV